LQNEIDTVCRERDAVEMKLTEANEKAKASAAAASKGRGRRAHNGGATDAAAMDKEQVRSIT
jgi:hypothetical protein